MKWIAALFFLTSPFFTNAQQTAKDSLLAEVTLDAAVKYALVRQPVIQQAVLDQEILEYNIRSKLADWYPQINFNGAYQHNFIIQTSVIGGNPVRLGVNNTSAGQFTLSQAVFNRDVLLASRSRGTVRLQAAQNTEANKIDVATQVAKAYYDVLSTMQQIRVTDENIRRVERSLKDAEAQYQAGVTDKIDYKRATIALNNARASKKSNEALLQSKLEYLKSLMGYPVESPLNIVYDSLQMEQGVAMDTVQKPQYSNRIEYQLLETQRKLLIYDVSYNKWSYLPTVSINGAYNLNYQNNEFTKLYGNNYPNSFAAVTLGFPIFQGGKRRYNIKQAELQVVRNDLEMIGLRNNINAEYAQALGTYKSAFENYLALKENMALASEVYDVINLQYRSGIKAYLEVITAETDLRTAQINYYASLYQVLISKVDVQKALGLLKY